MKKYLNLRKIHFPYVKALVQSFYSPEIYRNAITRWPGFGGRYLAVLAAVMAVIIASGVFFALVPYEKKELPYIAKQIPQMELNDGVITVASAKQPVLVQSRDKKFTMIIDTEKSPSDLRQTKSQFAVGRDFVLLQAQDNTYQTVDLRKIKGRLPINENLIYRYLGTFKIILLPLLWLGQMVNLFIKVIVVTVLSYLVTALMREEYDFVTRMRLSVVALTPAVIISTLLALGFDHDVAPWFFMLVSCLYIYVMIVMMRRLPPVENLHSTMV